jgi:hypothetical protein
VADDLVDDVRFGRVERLGRVADVLRGVKDAVGQGAVELAQGDEARGAAVLEARQRAQAVGDLAELRDVVLGQPQQCLALEVLPTGVRLVLVVQLAAHDPPDLVLGVGVVDVRDRLARRPRQRGGGDLVATRAVVGVVEAGMVLAEMDLDLAVIVLGDRRVELGFLEHLPLLGWCATTQGHHLGTRLASLHGSTGQDAQHRAAHGGRFCAT